MLVYRILLSIALPFGCAFAALQMARGRENLADLRERLGAGLQDTSHHTAPTLWVHGASNGEITGARALIEDALERHPSLQVIVTVNSTTARTLVKSWQMPHVSVRLAPIDLRRTTQHFIACTRPNALLSIENELWPNRFTQCAENGIPVIVSGARMSESTAQSWQKYKRILQATTKATLHAISNLAAQDQASQERFTNLGIAPDKLLPLMNLKSGVELQLSEPGDIKALTEAFPKERTILAASTHEGEDQIILLAMAEIKNTVSDARLIIAPRHPARADDIEVLARQNDLTVARRSRDESPAQSDVYLADTLGEMPVWYGLSDYTFVGGSLAEKGGHTPFEPAQFGSVILHGPHVSNHAEAFTALTQSGGAIEVRDARSLAQALLTLIAQPEHAAELAQKGAAALSQLRKTEQGSPNFWNALDQAIYKNAAHESALQ